MSNIHRIENISELNKVLGISKPTHPLISVVDFSKVNLQIETTDVSFVTGLYLITLKNQAPGELKYGRNYYDFQEGTLFFLAPEQVVSVNPETNPIGTEGWGVFFHPDLIRKLPLFEKMSSYSFFSYDANEALHLSEKEKHILTECVENIKSEIENNIDGHTQTLTVSNIELMLNYCTRFYNRQFITRSHINSDVVSKFETLLREYFESDDLHLKGLPSVKFCSENLCFSPNYLSDLLRKETGKNAQEHIHYYVIEKAKGLLLNSNLTASEIAFQLGFEYSQYFSKIFKKKTGYTPTEFRTLN